MLCPLCQNDKFTLYFKDKYRSYFQCSVCKLVFVPKEYYVSIEDEKADYDHHQNSASDPGYRRFLSRLTQPLCDVMPSQQHGLDFGCGPGPALSALMEEKGHKMDLYDPIYYPDSAVLDKKYDFICATEVVEHFQDIKKHFDRLFDLLKPHGWLGIMTKLVKDQEAFKNWHYIRDKTHISFFSKETFLFIAPHYKADLNFIAKDVILLHKQSKSN